MQEHVTASGKRRWLEKGKLNAFGLSSPQTVSGEPTALEIIGRYSQA